MKRIVVFVIVALIVPMVAMANLKDNEKNFFGDLQGTIPADRIMNVDDLNKKWHEVQEGKSNAIILDIRTEAEFNNGHILGSSNIDSGHAYQLPKKIKDPNQEIWVFCRTQHRATYFAGMLYKYGYKNVYLVKGGIKGWAEKGYPLYNTYFGEIKVVKYEKKLKEEYWYRENR